MEENQNNGDVSPEAVAQVIAENGNQAQQAPVAQPVEVSQPVAQPVAPQTPAVEVLPTETQQVDPAQVVPPIAPPAVKQPSVPLEGQSGSLPLTQQPEAQEVAQPAPAVVQQQAQGSSQPVRMKFLQFECSGCEMKVYVNLEDDKLNELPDKLKCISCGKKKAIKKRIMAMTWNGVAPYVAPLKQPAVTQ